jgi:hypothetical protein
MSGKKNPGRACQGNDSQLIERHMHDPEIPKLVAFDRLPWGLFKRFFTFLEIFSGLCF